MPFPSVVNSATTDGTTATATPAITLPGSRVVGNMLVAAIRVAATGAIEWPLGWIELSDVTQVDQISCAFTIIDGTEGSSVTVTCTSAKFAALCWQIKDFADPFRKQPLATDDFNRANETPIAGNWSSAGGTFSSLQLSSNALTHDTASVDGASYYSAIAWPDSQYAEIQLTNLTNDGGPAVRISAAAKTAYILSVLSSGGFRIVRILAGVNLDLFASAVGFSVGDVAGISVRPSGSGSVITAFRNGKPLAGAYNADIASGNAGAFIFSNTLVLDNWVGGSLDSGIYPDFNGWTTGNSTTPDPSSSNPATGAQDYLWLWLGGWEGEQTSPPAGQPSGWSGPIGANSGTGGAVATNCRVAGAWLQSNTGTMDAPSWTISAADDWVATVIAIHPYVPAPNKPTIVRTAVPHAATW